MQSLGDGPLAVVQSVTDVSEILLKLGGRYASASQNNKINVLTTLLNKKMAPNGNIFDHVAEMEGLFTRLEAMSFSFDENLQVAMLLISVSEVKEFEPAVGAIKIYYEWPWNYVSTRLIKDGSSLRNTNVKREESFTPASVDTIRSKDIVCHRCGIKGHIAADCRQPWNKIEECRKYKKQELNNSTNELQYKTRVVMIRVMKRCKE